MVIDDTKIDNIIKMLAGETEDQIVALSILDKLVEDNPATVLLSYKFCKVNDVLWAQHALNAFKYIRKVCKIKGEVELIQYPGNDTYHIKDATVISLTFNDIFDTIYKTKDKEQMDLFFKYFMHFVTEQCLKMRHNFMAKVKIKMELNE
tara:strand:- start:345 stop:791 length:447 start_codon:yes stop_codon:yes gene_type:complete